MKWEFQIGRRRFSPAPPFFFFRVFTSIILDNPDDDWKDLLFSIIHLPQGWYLKRFEKLRKFNAQEIMVLAVVVDRHISEIVNVNHDVDVHDLQSLPLRDIDCGWIFHLLTFWIEAEKLNHYLSVCWFGCKRSRWWGGKLMAQIGLHVFEQYQKGIFCYV